ncbi:MAG: ATPase [Candidatus Ozemobacter sibiricus]|uniref:ATPase n=1 Tax=Candidatus Ozemobacter sibiricus TaxID=2268124 RepID=A0A367ZI73_9BACT|nr:MAG: ATPase [Candidatus Ozemobacter sibiricus]
MFPRTLVAPVLEILRDFRKMAFISGPRQVGKTTLAKKIGDCFPQRRYFNWDIPAHQSELRVDPAFFEKDRRDPRRDFLVIFDEIHKLRGWKNYLKGVFDQFEAEMAILVTGSGRLDLFQKGGDSLLGRYFHLPLYPLTVGELQERSSSWQEFLRALEAPGDLPACPHYEALFRFGGFPEPLKRAQIGFYRRWSEERRKLLVREDIRDATAIRQISGVETLSRLLPERVGAPLSLNSLREDLQVAFDTVKDWLAVLEQFYVIFRIPPFAPSIKRAIRKEAKVYSYDWAELADEGRRFENLLALHLKKAVALWRAMGQAEVTLHYLRDLEKREVDFLIADRNRPICLIESKLHDQTLAKSLVHFQEALHVPFGIQVIHTPGVCFRRKTEGGYAWVVSADRFLSALP